MALNKRERILLVTTIGALVVGVSYLLLSPLTKAWTSLRGQITAQRSELQMIRTTIAHAPGWRQQYDALRGSLGNASERFSSPTDVLKKVQEVGSRAGVAIINSSELRSVEKDVYRELPVKCTFEATTESLVKFLYERLAQFDDPRRVGQALRGSELGDLWKYRVGDYRIFARIMDDVVQVVVVEIGHRREIYR